MVTRSVWLLFVVGVCGLPLPVSAQPPNKQPVAELQPEQPHDLILAVDVSLSMLMDWTGNGRTFPASDREGMRWDGLQFAVDVAQPQDRVALVLYRAENVVLSKFVDESGFVSLSQKYPQFGNKTGREVLAALITEIQQQEEFWAKKIKDMQATGQQLTDDTFRTLDFKLLQDGPGGKIILAHGTASLLALKTIAKELLPKVRPGAQGWTLLFTDGVEMGPARPSKQFPGDAFAYIKEREKLKGAGLVQWAGPWVQDFRQRGVPVCTFALGDDCDLPLLRAIAQQSSKPGPQERTAASYELQNNVQLLDQLHNLLYSLRDYWKRSLEPDRRDQQQEIFSSPKVQIWHDLGVLLYRQVAGSPQARAPVAAHMKTPRVGDKDLTWLKPLMSRSHWYYRLSLLQKEAKQAKLTGDLEFQILRPISGEKYVTRAVAAFRTQQSLFHFREPTADGGKLYTPRDAIPFLVEFTPYAVADSGGKREVPFLAADFEIAVTFAPAGTAPGKPDKRARTFTLPLQPLVNAPEDGRLAALQFRKELVLDSGAKSAGKLNLAGLYDVDVTITGIKGPLAGARRQLLRRTLEIGPYPTLTTPKKIMLTNESPETIRHTLPAELDQRTDPSNVVTDVSVSMPRGPIAQNHEIHPKEFHLQALHLQGKKGTLTLELPAAAWTKLPLREFKHGTLELRAPWQSEGALTEVIVRKLPYKLSATPDVMRLDLSAHSARQVTREIQVALQTRLATAEPVWLSASDTTEREQPEQLTFQQIADDKGAPLKAPFKAVTFRCKGLGKPQQVPGGEPVTRASLQFTLAHDGKLSAGVYQRQLYLVGEGVVAAPVTVQVAANMVTVLSDRSAKALDEVYLFGLAGTEVRQTLRLQSGLGAKVKGVRPMGALPLLHNIEAGGWDQLALTSVVSADDPDQLTLGLKVPLCVQSGRYRTVVQLEVNAEEAGQATKPLLVSLPVYLEVRQTGVRLQVGKDLDFKGPLRLPSGSLDPCAPFATAEVQLATDALKAPVRWRVEQVAPTAGLGQALALKDGRVEVLFKGRSLLGKQGTGEPIRHDHPCPLTIKVFRNLEPGWYRAALRFHAAEDHSKAAEGQPLDLQLQLLVPGRRLEAVAVSGERPIFGGETEVHFTLACYGCEPGQGELLLFNADGTVGATTPLKAKPQRSAADKHLPALVRHEYRIQVKPPRPGGSPCQLRWPALCPGQTSPTPQTVTVQALSRIDVSRTIAYVDEELTIRAVVDPALAPEGGRPLVLRAVPRSDNGLSPFDIELFDDGHKDHDDEQAGDGIYSGRRKFTRLGEYDLHFPTANGGSAGKPATVRVAFEFRCPEKFGPMEYGGGQMQKWFGLTDELLEPRAIHLANGRSHTCRWRARLLFPKTVGDARQLAERNSSTVPATPTANPQLHLDLRLTGVGDREEMGWVSGTLRPDEELDLGLEGQLSEAARAALATGDSHASLGHDNGMLLEVELVWVDDQGREVERRQLRVPFTVRSQFWLWNAKPWLAAGVVVVGAFFGWRGLGRLRRRWRERRAAQPVRNAASEVAATPVASPSSSGTGQHTPEPPPIADDDDLLPDYLR